jgi:hypothetical protein
MSFVFDPFDYKTFQPDPWPIYAELREDHPVYHNPQRGFWALSRFEDVQAAARDWQTFSSADGVNLDDIAEVEGPGNFLDMDPPRHDQLRDVVKRWFSPRALRELEPAISAKADALVDKIVSEERSAQCCARCTSQVRPRPITTSPRTSRSLAPFSADTSNHTMERDTITPRCRPLRMLLDEVEVEWSMRRKVVA